MLATVLRKLNAARKDGVGIVACADPAPERTAAQMRSYGMQCLFPLVPSDRPRRFPLLYPAAQIGSRLAPRGMVATYGLVPRVETDALIDISGYAFGDEWGTWPTRNAAIRAESYRRRGKPVVLMPQMFGPFKTRKSVVAFRRLARASNHMFARDKRSFRWASGAAGPEGHLSMAPDMTIFTDPAADGPRPPEGDFYVCIVPNIRMLDQGAAEWSAVYVDRLVAAAKLLTRRGVPVSILVHDATGKDRSLAGVIAGAVSDPRCRIVEDTDPLRLKRYLGGARFVIASRFHAVVSSLSAGVPAITLGWAHKYEELLEDFDVPELKHMPGGSTQDLLQMIDGLLDEGRCKELRGRLEKRKGVLQVSNQAMWNRTFELLSIVKD